MSKIIFFMCEHRLITVGHKDQELIINNRFRINLRFRMNSVCRRPEGKNTSSNSGQRCESLKLTGRPQVIKYHPGTTIAGLLRKHILINHE